jgi:hypothetical protein
MYIHSLPTFFSFSFFIFYLIILFGSEHLISELQFFDCVCVWGGGGGGEVLCNYDN